MKYNKSCSLEVYKACYDITSNPFIEYYLDKIIPYINSMEYEFIGLSITGHSQLIAALTLCRLIRENCKKVKHISLGGNYITRAANLICDCGYFDSGFFDTIMLYEGEISCKELLYALNNNSPISEVHNIIYKNKNKWIYTNFLVNDIINTCTPDFSDYPLGKYFVPSTVYPIFTSRSCYNKCAFCTIPNATSGHYRALPLSAIIKNIKSLKEKYNAQFISITDETFDIKRMLKFADALIKDNIKIYWYCETRFSPNISLDTCRQLYKSGCRQIQFGLESYNQRVLDKMEKNTKIEWINEAIDNCLKANISVHLFFFTGFPTETYEEAMNTYYYTSKKVTESQIKYKTISSRGYGSFGLEIGSTVWKHPENYGITIIPNDKNCDLRLNVNYNTSIGLSQKESEDLVNANNLRDGLQSRKNLEYEIPWVDFIPEIHMAIKATMPSTFFKKNITYVLSNKKIKDILCCHQIEIPKWISISKTDTNIIFYNRRLNQAYAIPSKCIKNKVSCGCFNFNEIFFENSETFGHLSLLYHFSFIEINSFERRSVDVQEDIRLIKAKNIYSYYNTVLKEWVLFNEISNDSVAVNSLCYKLSELFDKSLVYKDFLQILQHNHINLEKTSLDTFISYLLQHDILYALL